MPLRGIHVNPVIVTATNRPRPLDPPETPSSPPPVRAMSKSVSLPRRLSESLVLRSAVGEAVG